MISIEIAVLLTSAALSISSWLLKLPVQPLSLRWTIFFSLVYSRDEIWTATTTRQQGLTIVFLTSILIYTFFRLYKTFTKESRHKTDVLENESSHRIHASGLKPLAFPARTTHTRFFPQKHSFSYSYLLVGIPVGWRGRIGSFLSVDITPQSLPGDVKARKSWFTINGVDYLERGGEESSLQEKLQAYLMTQVGKRSL